MLTTHKIFRAPRSQRVGPQLRATMQQSGGKVKSKVILEVSQQFPKPNDFHPSYGTGGFRDKGDKLSSTLFRCGVIAAIRSWGTGLCTGLMVTASHNPEVDNGAKLVDPDGGMLPMELEDAATEIACADTEIALSNALTRLLSETRTDRTGEGTMKVIVAHDTRPTSVRLAEAAARGIMAAGAQVDFRGLLTTPQCHFIVQSINKWHPDTEDHYFQTLLGGFADATAGLAWPEPRTLVVDCANGVGAGKMSRLRERLAAVGVALELRNTGEGRLNDGCGADFVQKEQVAPLGCSQPGTCGVSIDGDADRAVYFTTEEDGSFRIFDGDRIASLAALELQQLLRGVPGMEERTVGVVQTAYANGSSTLFLKTALNCPVVLTKTGVKHLHAAAHKFDIGIYFEANGHGTVIFSPDVGDALEKEAAAGCQSAKYLIAFSKLMNQAVGDAISVLLMVEAVLLRRKCSMQDWGNLYTELATRQLKVKVSDRTLVKTEQEETVVVSPKGLQDKINAAIATVDKGRSFVRPSGTEDVVRVYAEALTQEEADALAHTVAKAVSDMLSA